MGTCSVSRITEWSKITPSYAIENSQRRQRIFSFSYATPVETTRYKNVLVPLSRTAESLSNLLIMMPGHVPMASEVHLPLQSQVVKQHKQLFHKCQEHVCECSESKQWEQPHVHGYRSRKLSTRLKRLRGPSLPVDDSKTRTNSISLLPGGRSRTTGYSPGKSPLRRQMTKSLWLVSTWSLRCSAARLCSSNVKYLQVPSSKSSTPPSSLAVLWKMVRRAGVCRRSSTDGDSSNVFLVDS